MSSPAGIGKSQVTSATLRMTMDPGTLKTGHFLHAWGIVIVPTLGVLVALFVSLRVGVTALDLALLATMYMLTSLGITVGLHRLFSHRSFEAATPVRVALGILGCMAGQGSISYWITNHRRHHHYADGPEDLHSPYFHGSRKLRKIEGFIHSHMGWTFQHRLTNPLLFAKDLYRDRAIAFVNQAYLFWVFLSLLIPFAVGGLVSGTWQGAFTGFLWGGLVRLFLTYHVTNSIDSVTHIFGTRPFDVNDYSTNNVWMALPTLGEGWHNNHHAFPNSAFFSLCWWQIDPGGLFIRAMEKLGWVWKAQSPSAETVQAKLKRVAA